MERSQSIADIICLNLSKRWNVTPVASLRPTSPYCGPHSATHNHSPIAIKSDAAMAAKECVQKSISISCLDICECDYQLGIEKLLLLLGVGNRVNISCGLDLIEIFASTLPCSTD